MTAAVVALSAAVLLLAVLVAGLLRSHADILKALHELGAGLELDQAAGPVPVTIDGVSTPRRSAGSEIPAVVTGSTLDGDVVALSLEGQDTLIAFLSSGCTTCQEFWKTFRDRPPVPEGARLLVVTRGLDEESESALRDREPSTVPLVLSDETWDAFEVPGSPYFVHVDAGGRLVGEGSGASWAQVLDLLAQSRADALLRERGNGAVRESRDERALSEAGITPGHPSLYDESS